MECPGCKKKSFRGAKYCAQCGAAMNGTPKRETTTAPSSQPNPNGGNNENGNKPKRQYEQIL